MTTETIMSCAVIHRARAFRISELQEHPSNPEAEKIMGLYLKKVLENKAEIAVWQITESEEELKALHPMKWKRFPGSKANRSANRDSQ